MKSPAAWYEDWFNDKLYRQLYAHRDTAEARRAISLFLRITGLKPKHGFLLDLACGDGRHATELAQQGFRVFAADLSSSLLAEAQRKTRRFTALQLVRADMRHIPLRHSMAATIQLFTAFGYFSTDKENQNVLQQVRATLVDGGWYMLDFLNAPVVQNSIQPYSVADINGITIEQRRVIQNGRVEKTIIIHEKQQSREYKESVRLFTLDDFQRMFPECGLTLEAVFGDYDGVPYNDQASRCIMFTRAR